MTKDTLEKTTSTCQIAWQQSQLRESEIMVSLICVLVMKSKSLYLSKCVKVVASNVLKILKVLFEASKLDIHEQNCIQSVK